MRTPRYETRPISTARLETLADGVFAIVMTLLVLKLGVPVATDALDDAGLAEELREMWPEFLIYGLSFLVLGVFWLMHHAVFDSIERYDTTLAWLNVVFLMFTALLPFSTELFGEHGDGRVTALVYGANMLAAFLMLWAMFAYATAGRRLVSDDLDANLIRGGRQMGLLYGLVMAAATLIAFVSPVLSFALFGLIVAVIIALTVLGRWDVAMVVPTRETKESGTPPVD